MNMTPLKAILSLAIISVLFLAAESAALGKENAKRQTQKSEQSDDLSVNDESHQNDEQSDDLNDGQKVRSDQTKTRKHATGKRRQAKSSNDDALKSDEQNDEKEQKRNERIQKRRSGENNEEDCECKEGKSPKRRNSKVKSS